MFLDGQFVDSKTTKWIDLHNPVSYSLIISPAIIAHHCYENLAVQLIFMFNSWLR